MMRFLATILLATTTALIATEPRSISGIYPSLATFNKEGECGTGAVVPWAERLWIISYGPHKPQGSTDKLYEITPDLQQIIRPESVGGTPANRMIHRESNQLFIGPYAIDAKRNVRVITPQQMFGRLTGMARHLTDPAGKICYATMEEGIYEVDVKSLAVSVLWVDEQLVKGGAQKKTITETLEGRAADLPGYHGKGFYSAQGRYVYANNGDHAKEALTDPTTPSGVLAEWDGKTDKWNIVRRNQFTDVTGPGGITGESKADDPLWAVGWDHRSVILMCLDNGQWHSYRLPKASHCYDGAHGWNTEWPRIREIGDEMLMTMHGMFWRFPKTFSSTNSAGLAPRSTYLKVIGDFCRWNDRIVLGCDDTAKSEFLNNDKLKGDLSAPGISNSNLWFIKPSQLDECGPAIGRGGVWVNEPVKADAPSDAFLFSGFDHRMVHLEHDADREVTFKFEIDRKGSGNWEHFSEVTLAPRSGKQIEFKPEDQGAWIRLRTDRDVAAATAVFHFRNKDARDHAAAAIFDGIAMPDAKSQSRGVMLVRGGDMRTLRLAAKDESGKEGCYDLDGDLNLKLADDAKGLEWTKQHAAIPKDVISEDAASIVYTDERRHRWRLPRVTGLTDGRVCREVCTERNMLNVGGTFYELPAQNAGGFIKVRPIATHGLGIHDYASYRGLMFISGINAGAQAGDHIIRSDDGKVALWAGAVDDLWKLGKPRGRGGPWKDTSVKANKASDPFLMTGFDHKKLVISQKGGGLLRVRLEADFTGTGTWSLVQKFEVKNGRPLEHKFSEAFTAYWVRLVPDGDATVSAEFIYE